MDVNTRCVQTLELEYLDDCPMIEEALYVYYFNPIWDESAKEGDIVIATTYLGKVRPMRVWKVREHKDGENYKEAHMLHRHRAGMIGEIHRFRSVSDEVKEAQNEYINYLIAKGGRDYKQFSKCYPVGKIYDPGTKEELLWHMKWNQGVAIEIHDEFFAFREYNCNDYD